jgi:Fic family protein
MPDPLLEGLHRIDSRASGRIAAPAEVVNEDSRDRFLVSSLIEEAITSSQLEGAATTRQEAVQMLRGNRRPRDKSEQMILNNFLAMQKIGSLRHQPMSLDLILALHSALTEDTLDDTTAAGRFQTSREERVRVVDHSNGQTLHQPPPADSLEARVNRLVDFANDELHEKFFIHPIIRAIILHFWLAYDHPFVDGNGRVARALFYWSAARSGYWLLEFISISRILRQAPSRYARSFLYVETDENDLTYFLIEQVATINRALDSLERYLLRKSEQIRRVNDILQEHGHLNHRKIALLSHAVRHPGHRYTIKSHQISHRVAYATARKDLLDLAEMELLVSRPIDRRTFGFIAPQDVEERLRRMASSRDNRRAADSQL